MADLRKSAMLVKLYFPEVLSEFDAWRDREQSTGISLKIGLTNDEKAAALMQDLNAFNEAQWTLEKRLEAIAPTLLKPKLLRWSGFKTNRKT